MSKKLICENMYSKNEVKKIITSNSVDDIVQKSIDGNDLSLVNYLAYVIQVLCASTAKFDLKNEVDLFKSSVVFTFNLLDNIDNKYSDKFRIDFMYTHVTFFDLDRKEYDINGLKEYYEEYINEMNQKENKTVSQAHIDFVLRNLQLLIEDMRYLSSFKLTNVANDEFYRVYKELVIAYKYLNKGLR